MSLSTISNFPNSLLLTTSHFPLSSFPGIPFPSLSVLFAYSNFHLPARPSILFTIALNSLLFHFQFLTLPIPFAYCFVGRRAVCLFVRWSVCHNFPSIYSLISSFHDSQKGLQKNWDICAHIFDIEISLCLYDDVI